MEQKRLSVRLYEEETKLLAELCLVLEMDQSEVIRMLIKNNSKPYLKYAKEKLKNKLKLIQTLQKSSQKTIKKQESVYKEGVKKASEMNKNGPKEALFYQKIMKKVMKKYPMNKDHSDKKSEIIEFVEGSFKAHLNGTASASAEIVKKRIWNSVSRMIVKI